VLVHCDCGSYVIKNRDMAVSILLVDVTHRIYWYNQFLYKQILFKAFQICYNKLHKLSEIFLK